MKITRRDVACGVLGAVVGAALMVVTLFVVTGGAADSPVAGDPQLREGHVLAVIDQVRVADRVRAAELGVDGDQWVDVLRWDVRQTGVPRVRLDLGGEPLADVTDLATSPCTTPTVAAVTTAGVSAGQVEGQVDVVFRVRLWGVDHALVRTGDEFVFVASADLTCPGLPNLG